MNQNYLDKHLDVVVLKDKTIIKFWKNEDLKITHEHNIGLKIIEDQLVNEIILSDWINGIIYVLNKISLEDRVPTHIYLTTEKYGNIFEKKIKEENTYSQFYLEDSLTSKGVHVIIKKINYTNINSLITDSSSQDNLLKENNKKPKSYERYTKTISQFKI